MTDDERTAYSIRAAEAALQAAGDDYAHAVTALFQAAASILISKLGPALAVGAMAEAGPIYAEHMAERFGLEVPKR